jgi:hypothetical protein
MLVISSCVGAASLKREREREREREKERKKERTGAWNPQVDKSAVYFIDKTPLRHSMKSS